GKPLKGRWRDAEGLTLRHGANGVGGDTRLLVSFEQHPRLVAYGPQGKFLEALALSPELAKVENYRGPNNALETLVLHPQWGLITAPELPLRSDSEGQISLVGAGDRRWRYPLADRRGSALVAAETMDNGNLLIMERAWVSVWIPLVISFSEVALKDEGALVVHRRIPLDAGEGWRLDNFEGLARHRENRFFMVSDDNGSEMQRTLLAYFLLGPLP
ncbi:MAG: esterase-like activity of phytase family protein, partial [Pseudomonadota bacterium]